MTPALTVHDLPSPAAIARVLGGELAGGHRIRCPGPGHSARDRSLEVMLSPEAPEGYLVHSFAGDDPLRCRDYVREKLGLERRAFKRSSGPRRVVLAPKRTPSDYEADVLRRLRIAQSLWSKSRDGEGTLAEAYLKTRGLNLGRWPATLRFLPARPPAHLWAALVAGYGLPTEPEPGVLALAVADVVGVQLTYLRPDGSGKAPIDPAKRTIGRGHTLPIVLAPATDSLGLVVAEGIEDALSLHVGTGLAAWAAGGAERMPGLAEAVPAYVEAVTIAADDNPAGHKGAAGLHDRLRARGVHVQIAFLDNSKNRNCRDDKRCK